MGPYIVYAAIVATCLAGIFRPFWGLAGYLFLLYLQPEWIWRYEGLYELKYQKYCAICLLVGTVIQGSKGSRLRGWAAVSMSAMFGFLALAWLSSQNSVSTGLSSFYVDVLWKTVLIAFVIVKLLDTPRKAVQLMWAVILGCGFNSLRLNEDYFTTGVTRFINDSWGLKGDNNVYTLFVFPAMTSSAVLAFTSKDIKYRALAGFIALLLVHQLMLLESRGGMLGAVLSGTLLFFMIRKTWFTYAALFLGISAVLFLAGPQVQKEFLSIFAAKEERDASAESRFALWRAAVNITLDYPLLGVGPNAGQVMIPKYAIEYSEMDNKHPHNVFLEVSSGCGIPAVMLFLAFLLIPYWRFFSFRNKYVTQSEFASSISLSALITVPGFCLSALFAGGGMIESVYLFVAIWTGGFLSIETQHSDLEYECETTEVPFDAMQLPAE
jgi:O-antigen ligase